MKTLTLDYEKWRSGRDGEHKTGYGKTQLKNKDGFLDANGQFILQVCKKIKAIDLRGCKYLKDEKHGVILPFSYRDTYGYGLSTTFTDIQDINDDQNTTPEEKICLIRKVLASKNYQLEVINKPH